MAAAPSDPEQAEKDLLARARDALERYCNTTRYRHLYPQGANVALLLTAYQDLQRLHRVGRVRWRSQRHKLRLLKARLKEQVRADALDRSRRLSYGFPSPKPSPILGDPPPVVWRALDDVAVDNPDTADEVRQFIAGRQVQELTADVSLASRSRVRPRLARGLAAFRDALVARSLGDPRSIPGLHPQYLALARSPLPLRKKRPIARLLLVKLPLYFWLSIIALLTTAYTGAYFFFNHENLGRFMTFAIGKAIDGELEFGSVSWKPSLIVDLVTGQPARVVCRDVKVWAPFKSLGHEKRMITAQADEIEVDIVLHEIIPWNIIGIPSVFEIPWVLHFTRAHSEGKVDVLVKQYADTDAEGNEVWLTSLTDAFKPGPTPRPQRNVRGLSFQMDALTLPINLDLDLRAKSTWQLELDMDVATFSLDFLGPHPLEPPPDEKPLRFRVEGHAEEGLLSILSLGEGGYFIPLYDFDLDDFTAGMDEAPLGDIRVRGAGFFAESPGALDGWLLDIFDPARAVDARLEVTDAGPLARTILDAHGMPDRTVDAEGALAELEFQGLMADPTITLATSGVRLNFFDDPALDWSVNDASVRAILHKERIPPRWADRQDPEAVTWLVDLDRFEGQALGGSLQIHQFGDRSHIVLPPGGGEILLAADLDLTDIDPGRLTASETLSPLLAGAATGRLQVPRLVLRTGIETRLARAELELESFDYIRERGPRDDGVPHRLRADGGVVYDELEGIDLTDLRLATDGASLDITGGIDAEFERLDPTRLHVRVSDGKTLWDSYGRAPFFDRLDLQMTLSGPVGAPDGRNGSLSISGVGTGEFAVTGIEDVDLRMDSGTIALKSRKVEMLGGAGPFAAQIKLFERGELSKDPKLQLSLDLEEAEIQRVVGDRVQGTADVHIELGDPDGNPVPLSKYQVRGALFSPQLIVGVTPFANVEAAFDITPEGLAIRRLELPYHRAISPYHAPGVTIPVGELSGEGSFSFDKDPVLDIKLAARELPVAALVGMAGVEDLPLAGQVSRKSALKLGGTLSKPDVEGDIHLAALSAGGIPLGAGALKLESRDVSASDGLAARREVRVSGNFRDPSGRGGPGKLAYKVRATVAIGETKKRGLGPISTAFAAEFDSLPLARLLHGKDALNERIVGGLEGLSVSAEFCDSAVLLLEECRAGHGQSAGMAGSTRLDVGLARFWMRSRTGGRGRKSSGTGPSSQAKKGPPRSAAEACDDTEALCSDPRTPLKAELDGTVVRLRDDWTLLSWDEGPSGLVPHRLTLAGEVDL
ncbi:MAG: hypothetical protein KC636_14565, partial [Myxococcales bacterium]|nr:hypothetical protein [Myxococcales bacterium]